MHWIYNIPTWQLGASIVSFFTLFAVVGALVSRKWVRSRLHDQDQAAHNDIVNNYLSAIGIFYGLTSGLIAVAAWENAESMNQIVSQEAATLGMLYADVLGYPPEVRDRLRAGLEEYVRAVIDKEWPAQRNGGDIYVGRPHLARVFEEVLRFEPTTEREKILHSEVIDVFNHVFELRRERISNVDSCIPHALWGVVLIGSIITVGLTFLFWTENVRLHLILNAAVGLMVGMMMFIIVALDHPFWGEVSVSPDAYKDLLRALVEPL